MIITNYELRITDKEIAELLMVNSEIGKVGIIGEGKMGTNLFYHLLDFGFEMVWICSPEADLAKIRKSFEKKMKRAADAGIMDEDSFSRITRQTVITGSLASLAGCDLVIEAIVESESAKRALFDEILPVVSSSCILTSNTSSISPLKLMNSPEARSRFAGLHFFYPVSMKNILEINRTDELAEEALSSLLSFAGKIGKECLLADKKGWFILNRIFLDIQVEAFKICREEDLSVDQVDELIRQHLFPVGPFELCDSVGIDIMHTSVGNYISLSDDKETHLSFYNHLAGLIREGRLGVKSGAGFLDYPLEFRNNETMAGAITSVREEKILSRIVATLQSSVARFSALSGIPIETLSRALQDYLGVESAL